MTSTRPYLLRAMYEWMLDNGLTPQLVVDAQSDDVEIPRQYVKDGRIVLNVSPDAVRELSLGNDRVTFMARFAGQAQRVSVAPRQVLAIVARENGAGLSFPDEAPAPGEPLSSDSSPERDPEEPPPGGRPSLKLVK